MKQKDWVRFDRVWKIGRVVLGLATSQKKWSRYVELIRLHIRVSCMELRWRQPCSDSVAPCSIKDVETDKMIGKNLTANHANSNKISSKSKSSSRSFTSFEMFHTHASLPRGCFLATAKLLAKLLSRSWSRIKRKTQNQNTGRGSAFELSGWLRTTSAGSSSCC